MENQKNIGHFLFIVGAVTVASVVYDAAVVGTKKVSSMWKNRKSEKA